MNGLISAEAGACEVEVAVDLLRCLLSLLVLSEEWGEHSARLAQLKSISVCP